MYVYIYIYKGLGGRVEVARLEQVGGPHSGAAAPGAQDGGHADLAGHASRIYVYMCVYIYIYIYVCLFIYLFIYLIIYLFVYMCICMCIYIYIYV